MKSTFKLRIVVVAVIAIAVITGCFIPGDPGVGSVGIELPPPRGGEGTDSADFARIYVVNGPALLNVGDGAAYAETDLNPSDGTKIDEITVGPVPSGSGYRVVLVFGDYDATTDVFVPVEYALSNYFDVYAGQATPIDVTAGVTPFVPVDLLGESLVGIVYDGTALYVASQTDLYRSANPPTAGPLTFTDVADVPSGETANSITLGAVDGTGAAPWINTTEGVLPYTGAGGDFTVADRDYDLNAAIVSSVLDSGAYDLGGECYGYYQTDGGLGGVWDNNGAATPPAGDWLEEIDLSSFVAGVPVHDLAVYTDGANVFGFFATKLGAFRISDLLLENSISTAEEVFDFDDDLIPEVTDTTFFALSIDELPTEITQVAFDNDGPGAATDTLYLGSPRGAAWIDASGLGADDDPIDGTMIDESAGLVVEDIKVGGNLVVVRTTHFLIVSTDNGLNYVWYPLFASSVGDVSGMFLDTAGEILLLSGTTGLVGIDLTP